MADQVFAVNSGFYDAVNSDRTYSADDMNRPYKRVVSNGVFATPKGTKSTDLQVVSANNGMQIIVKKGEGIFADKWFENPAAINITVPANTSTVPRIDSVIVQVDKRTSGRVGNIVYRTGTPSVNPVAPSINTVANVTEYRLANIRVETGTTAITTAMITDRRGSSDCPWVTSLIYQVDTSVLYDQWAAAYEEYFEAEKDMWDDWYSHLTQELDVSMTLIKHTSTFVTTQETSEITIGISDFNANTDMLEVYINGMRAIEGGQYTINGSTSILLSAPLGAGQTVNFVCLKSVIMGNPDDITHVIEALEERIASITGGVPTVVDSTSAMTDTDKIYILTTDSKWYYYNLTSSAWVAGGVYGGVPTDTTLTQAGMAADAETVGNEIAGIKTYINNVPVVVEPESQSVDLYVCDAQGNVIAEFADGHLKTKNFDSSNVSADADVVKEANRTEADLYICDSFGNVIAEFKDGGIITKKFDSSDFANYNDVLANIESLSGDISDLKSATNGIIYRNSSVTDGVYAACRYHQPSLSSKQFCMLIAGDIHTDPTRMLSMIEYFNAIDAFDCGIMLGDMSGMTFDSPINHYTDAIVNVNKPWITVLGNHDVDGAANDASLWDKYSGCFQYAQLSAGEAVDGKCYYYKDFSTYKIRIIILMQYDYTYTGALCFGQTQINWLVNVLGNTPSDYGVIICEHTNPSDNMTYNMDFAYTSDTWRRGNSAPTDMVGNPIPDIVNAWINGTSLSKTYAYTFSGAPADLSVSADFSSRGLGEFITYLGGHWHMDVLGNPTEYANQPDYHVPAAGLTAATQGDIPRRTGTLSEDSFCALGIDRDKKTVKILHVGAYRTKDAINRQYFAYGYGGSNA